MSRLVASLETKVGGRLFDRTSRTVRLTPIGVQLREQVEPAYDQLLSALRAARDAARGQSGTLRIGFTSTTEGEPLHHLVHAFEAANPTCQVVLREVLMDQLYGALRRGEIDVLTMWLFVDEPDLTLGPVIDYQDRYLAVAASHVLADRESVCLDELGAYDFLAPGPLPMSIHDRIVPPRTPSGVPLRRTVSGHTWGEIIANVARGAIVHPTVASMRAKVHRSDVVFIPIRDMAPAPLGLVWCTAHENDRIRALAAAARSTFPPR